jgi:hypothetical protein
MGLEIQFCVSVATVVPLVDEWPETSRNAALIDLHIDPAHPQSFDQLLGLRGVFVGIGNKDVMHAAAANFPIYSSITRGSLQIELDRLDFPRSSHWCPIPRLA